MNLESIENKFGFVYPPLYKQMYQARFLDWGIPHSNWFKEMYLALKAHPPFLLYAKDFEILDMSSIAEEMERLTDAEDYRAIDPAYTFVPFATNGAGDLYCFLYTEEYKEDTPVVFMWHDSGKADIKAKNL